jgi:hypothetical protein
MARSAHTRTGILALALAVVPSPGAAQVSPIRPPMRAGERVAIGEDIGRYRTLYGEPESRTLDDEGSRPWPRMQNIRTVGSFSAIPGKGGSGSLPAHLGRLDLDSKYTTHMICGSTYCLALVAVPELRDIVFQMTSAWQYQDVEVIGAIDNVAKPTPNGVEAPTYAFQVWSISLAAGGTTRHGPREGPTLESLVRGPEAAAGRVITVNGVFRGANLFGDLPNESRRQSSDWVLQDGAFSVWVTGKAAKGGGWSLDPRSKTDCGFRLEVRARVETAGGFVYLRAKDVTLMGRARPSGGPPGADESH